MVDVVGMLMLLRRLFKKHQSTFGQRQEKSSGLLITYDLIRDYQNFFLSRVFEFVKNPPPAKNKGSWSHTKKISQRLLKVTRTPGTRGYKTLNVRQNMMWDDSRFFAQSWDTGYFQACCTVKSMSPINWTDLQLQSISTTISSTSVLIAELEKCIGFLSHRI